MQRTQHSQRRCRIWWWLQFHTLLPSSWSCSPVVVTSVYPGSQLVLQQKCKQRQCSPGPEARSTASWWR
uniref:Secreted protein n=1 Tax=Arundo donax TaxID=35708 RepID=A0A0A9H0Z2_ARUDO